MKKCIYFLAALLVLAGCDGLDYVSGGNNGNSGGVTPSTGSETVDGVAQPKGAIKHILDVQTDNRERHLFDFDDVYIYDADGRMVTDKCTQKTYNGESGTLSRTDNYEYTHHYYDGNRYEYWNTPKSSSKTQEGTLNAKGQLATLNRMSLSGTLLRTDSFTYDADGHLTKFVRDMAGGNKTTFTYTWVNGNMTASVETVTSGSSTLSTKQRNYSYSREVNPTRGHFLDLQYRCCFPEADLSMMLGTGPVNTVTMVYIVSSKANLGLVERLFNYEWNSGHTQIAKMERTVLSFPCEEEQILLKERTIDTYTVEYYK